MPTSHIPRRLAPPPAAVSLRRWLCAWLALLMLVQLMGSALAGLRATWHQHRPSLQAAAPVPSTVVVRWRHGDATALHAADAHAQLHAHGEAHDHPATDASVMPLGPDAASDAVAQLATTLATATDLRWDPRNDTRHVQAGAGVWVATMRSIAPPLQPPRG